MTKKKLTARRRQILTFIAEATVEHGYPPTVREIGEAVGLSSSSSVHFHLKALTEGGYLQRDGSLTRALRLSEDGATASDAASPPYLGSGDPSDARWVPLIGSVAAGAPIFAEEQCEDLVPLPPRFVPSGDAFMLRIEGNSMIEAGISDGDYVIVSRTNTATDGEMVVALIEDEATVKTFYRRDGGFELRPENAELSPIFTDDVQILGKVCGVLRSLI
ncbi:MAG TPA: transcriptional repressor LexA [Dehalococcoidia bacterium]|nr:transcriptional repressor LexA [Dehalococcoidia bacterium]